MKKLLLASIIGLASTTSFASGSTAPVISSSDSEIKLEGFYLFESGFSNQNRLGEFENLSDNRKKTAFYTEAAFAATITKTINDVIGGVKIVLQPTTRSKTSTSYNGSHIFIETSYGKVELGSPYDAGNKLRITGGQVAAGSGGYWRYINIGSKYMQYNNRSKPDFDTSPSFYIESFSNNFDEFNVKAEAARKISFYTPKMKGFQAGISYTPDSANTGGNKNINNVIFDNSITGTTSVRTGIKPNLVENNEIITINQNVTDSVSGGLTYEHALGEDADLKLSVTGEYGKPARLAVRSKVIDKTYTVLDTYKLSNLKAYNLGAVFTYGNFSCGASYGSLGKSLTTPQYHKNGRNTYYYNGAIAYGQGPIKTSLSYFKSSRYKNTVDTITVATEYKIMPGLLPYAEISHFQAKGKPVYYPEAPNKKTKGTVGLIGTKLKF